MRSRKIGILELVAATAALQNRLAPSFWIDLAVKRQYYSVILQAVSVWSLACGHASHYTTFSGLGQRKDLLPADLDLVFFAAPTQQSMLAYSRAAIFRARGACVVLAGPHARAYPEDCAHHADIVVTDCDRQVVEDIFAGQIDPGSIVACGRLLADLPLVKERAPRSQGSCQSKRHLRQHHSYSQTASNTLLVEKQRISYKLIGHELISRFGEYGFLVPRYCSISASDS